jgi:glycosyltransferase involved in cell wall biosynthesis
MISVVIATLNDEQTLAAVFAALIPAAVDALVREVIVVDGGSGDRTLQIADDAGARILSGLEIGSACQAAKSDWLLILDAKTPAPSGWENAALDHIREHAGEAGWWGASPGLAFWRRPKPMGLLIPRDLYAAHGASTMGRRMTFGR